MKSFIPKNKFEKSVHLVGFIIRTVCTFIFVLQWVHRLGIKASKLKTDSQCVTELTSQGNTITITELKITSPIFHDETHIINIYQNTDRLIFM